MTLSSYLPSAVVLGCRALVTTPSFMQCWGQSPHSNFTSPSAQQSHLSVFSTFLIVWNTKQKTSFSFLWATYLSFGEQPHSPKLYFWGTFWDYHIVMINFSLGKLLWGDGILWVCSHVHGCMYVHTSVKTQVFHPLRHWLFFLFVCLRWNFSLAWSSLAGW